MTRTLIVGTGDMAHALCHMFRNHNYQPLNHGLAISQPGLARRFLKMHPTFHDTGVPFVDLDAGLAASEVVLLVIPSGALKGFVKRYYKDLKDKILVDVTNSDIPGEDLPALLDLTETPWVKAFYDTGAVDLLLNRPYSKKTTTTTMCGSHLDAIQIVQCFAEQALGFSAKVVPADHYPAMARHQQSLGDDWVTSAYIMLALFTVTELYAVLRYNVYKGYDWFHLPLQVTNKAICWTSLNAFALTLLPGLLARLHDSWNGSKRITKPGWIRAPLQLRKPLGLLALWFLFLHIIMSLLLFNQKYYGKFFVDKNATHSKLNAIGEASFFFAVLGTGFYIILGVCSLPSVGSEMTSRSWQLVYGPLAWISLVFGTMHVLIMGVKGWNDQETWPGGLPPITMTSVLIPLLVMFLKLCQIATRYALRGNKNKTTHHKSPNNSFYENSKKSDQQMHGHSSKIALIRYGGPLRGVGGDHTPSSSGGGSPTVEEAITTMEDREAPSSIIGGGGGNRMDRMPSLQSVRKYRDDHGDDGSLGPC